MHEYSLAQSILTFCENELGHRPGYSIQEVTLLLGVMGGVDSSLLLRALDQLKKDGQLAETKFTSETDTLIIICNRCRAESSVNEILFYCPVCGNQDIHFQNGQELLVKSIKFGQKN